MRGPLGGAHFWINGVFNLVGLIVVGISSELDLTIRHYAIRTT